jgi:hypothetical protein
LTGRRESPQAQKALLRWSKRHESAEYFVIAIEPATFVAAHGCQIGGVAMIGNSGTTLGYASAGVLICLMQRLVANRVITQDEAAHVFDDAASLLANIGGGNVSIDAAVKLIRDDMKTRIAA